VPVYTGRIIIEGESDYHVRMLVSNVSVIGSKWGRTEKKGEVGSLYIAPRTVSAFGHHFGA
jgi:hypothetical protein